MAQQEGGTINTASKALQLCKDSMDMLITKRKYHLALCSYAQDLKSFFKQKRFSQLFIPAFESEVLDLKAKDEGSNNARRLAILEGKKYGRQLQKEIEEVDESSHDLPDTSNSSSPSLERVSLKVHIYILK